MPYRLSPGDIIEADDYNVVASLIEPNENAGETISAFKAVYLDDTDNEWKLSDANDTARFRVDGFSLTSGTDGNPMPVQLGGVVTGFSGLDAGKDYFLSDTAGEISTTPGTNMLKVGVALDATKLLLIQAPRAAAGVVADLNNTTTGDVNNDITVTLGFRPRLIKLYYFLQGYVSNVYGRKGIATYQGTTLLFDYVLWTGTLSTDDDTPTGGNAAALGDMFLNSPNATAAPTVGSNGNNEAQVTLTINSVSATGFVIREFVDRGTGSAQARAKVAYEAYE